MIFVRWTSVSEMIHSLTLRSQGHGRSRDNTSCFTMSPRTSNYTFRRRYFYTGVMCDPVCCVFIGNLKRRMSCSQPGRPATPLPPPAHSRFGSPFDRWMEMNSFGLFRSEGKTTLTWGHRELTKLLRKPKKKIIIKNNISILLLPKS